MSPTFPTWSRPTAAGTVPIDRDRCFPYSTWPSLAAAFLATTGISAALHAREVTGRGQHVETSLLQGVLIATWGGWQRAEHPDAPGYDTWIFDSRTTRGLFECTDGRWMHQWVPNPAFALGASDRRRASRHRRHAGAAR